MKSRTKPLFNGSLNVFHIQIIIFKFVILRLGDQEDVLIVSNPFLFSLHLKFQTVTCVQGYRYKLRYSNSTHLFRYRICLHCIVSMPHLREICGHFSLKPFSHCSQCKDGKKAVVPHVLSLRANMDRGMLAVLFNSLQKVQRVDSKQRQQQRMVSKCAWLLEIIFYLWIIIYCAKTFICCFQVLKLHPTLAPVKVAVDMGRGSTTELRQVGSRVTWVSATKI